MDQTGSETPKSIMDKYREVLMGIINNQKATNRVERRTYILELLGRLCRVNQQRKETLKLMRVQDRELLTRLLKQVTDKDVRELVGRYWVIDELEKETSESVRIKYELLLLELIKPEKSYGVCTYDDQ